MAASWFARAGTLLALLALVASQAPPSSWFHQSFPVRERDAAYTPGHERRPLPVLPVYRPHGAPSDPAPLVETFYDNFDGSIATHMSSSDSESSEGEEEENDEALIEVAGGAAANAAAGGRVQQRGPKGKEAVKHVYILPEVGQQAIPVPSKGNVVPLPRYPKKRIVRILTPAEADPNAALLQTHETETLPPNTVINEPLAPTNTFVPFVYGQLGSVYDGAHFTTGAEKPHPPIVEVRTRVHAMPLCCMTAAVSAGSRVQRRGDLAARARRRRGGRGRGRGGRGGAASAG
jgi:hypothetical protein